MSDEEKKEEVKKKPGRPKKEKASEKVEDPSLFGFKTKVAMMKGVNDAVDDLIAMPECKVFRFGAVNGHEKTTIWAISEVYIASVIYYKGPNRDNSMVTYDPVFRREALRLGSDLLKDFINATS